MSDRFTSLMGRVPRGAGGGVSASVENDWTAPQTYPTIQASPDPFIDFPPDATEETENTGFSFGARSYDFTTYHNYVWRCGHNMDPAGAAVDALRGVIKDEWEAKYEQFGVFNCERHLVFCKPGGSDQRFFTFNGSWTTTTPTNNSVGLYVERLRHRNAANDTDYWQCDSGVGFQIANWPFGVTVTSTDKIPIQASVPSAHTVDMMRLLYNSGAIWRVTKNGEMIIDSSTTAAGASVEPASLYVKGRVGTSYNFYVQASDGNVRIRVSQGTGAVAAIAFNSNFDNFGSFTQWNAAGSTLLFQVDGNGLLRTNQWTAASALGALSGVIPIKDDATGTTRYLPTYASFTP